MNAPTLYDRFIVPEGKRKVSFAADTKVESAGTFTVQREDHTLGTCGAWLRQGRGLRLERPTPVLVVAAHV
jgi:hypothetical protein